MSCKQASQAELEELGALLKSLECINDDDCYYCPSCYKTGQCEHESNCKAR